MNDKTVQKNEEAVTGIADDATLMVGGFGEAGAPSLLMEAIIDQGAKNLTIISNNAGEAYHGLAKLIAQKRGNIIPEERGKSSFSFLLL